MFRMMEGFERIDQWLIGLVWLVTWPVRIVWRLIAGLAALVLPRSLVNSLSGVAVAWSRFQRWLVDSVWGLVELLNLDGLMRWLAWLTQPLWRPIAAVGGFLFAWIATRPYKDMAWVAPCLRCCCQSSGP